MAVSSSLRSRRRPFLLWWVVACLVAILLVLPARAFYLRPPMTATQLTASHPSSAAATDASVTSDTTAANDDSTTVNDAYQPYRGPQPAEVLSDIFVPDLYSQIQDATDKLWTRNNYGSLRRIQFLFGRSAFVYRAAITSICYECVDQVSLQGTDIPARFTVTC